MFTERQRLNLSEACQKAFPPEKKQPDITAIKELLIALRRVIASHPLRYNFDEFDSARPLVEEAALWMKYAEESVGRAREQVNATGTREA